MSVIWRGERGEEKGRLKMEWEVKCVYVVFMSCLCCVYIVLCVCSSIVLGMV